MTDLLVYADFDFLPSAEKMGTLRFDRVRGNEVYSFSYEQEWLARHGSILLGGDLLPVSGVQYSGGDIFACFSDALPDRWGRTLAEKREAIDAQNECRSPRKLTSFDYLLSVDDYMRMGGFRFKESEAGPYLNDNRSLRVPPLARLHDLAAAADAVEHSDELGRLPEEKWLTQLLNPGSSLGGARPKANVIDADQWLCVAKFPSRQDRYDVALWEHFYHLLARQCGVTAAETRVMETKKKHHTLLSRRFDRIPGGKRIHYASAMTLLGLSDGAGASDGKGYLDIVDFILRACPETESMLEELYRRVAFNVCTGNSDDHFRNHGFLLSSKGWSLAPAFDLNPSLSQTQSLMITETTNEADLNALLAAHDAYFLPGKKAEEIVTAVKKGLKKWESLAHYLKIPASEVSLFEARLNQFLK